MRLTREAIPWAMSAGRAALGPVMMAGAACGWNGMTLAAMVIAALLSDIFDGVLARRWGCDTAAVRLFDSMADTFFYLCVGIALAMARPEIWRQDADLLLAVVGLETAKFVQEFVKFGKPASYHSYLAKTWGLALAGSVVSTFITGHAGAPMRLALWLGVVCLVEGMVMTIVLPVWSRDVKTLAAAWKIRRTMKQTRMLLDDCRSVVIATQLVR